MLRAVFILALSTFITACDTADYDDSEIAYSANMGVCNVNVQLTAFTDTSPQTGPFHFYGTTNAPENVTIRAIYVGSTKVSRTEFNFRSWNADLDLGEVKALAVNGVASVPVIAFTSEGCQALAAGAMPKVNVPTETDSDTE